MDMHRESSVVYDIRLIIKLLEHLCVQHADDKIKGAVIVGDNRKDCHLAFSELTQLQFIGLRNTCKGFQIEFLKAGNQGDLNRLQSLAGTGMVASVILQSNVFRVAGLKPFKQDIKGGTVILVILLNLTGTNHLHDHWEILLL